MKDQHVLIKGYRDLTQEEIDLMNEAKALGEKFGELHDRLSTRLQAEWSTLYEASAEQERFAEEHPDQDRDPGPAARLKAFNDASPQRWLSIAKEDMQTGIMAMVRAIARPTTF